MKLNISPMTEKQLHDTLTAIERKAEFDLLVELFKAGIVKRDEFIAKAEYYVPHFHYKMEAH